MTAMNLLIPHLRALAGAALYSLAAAVAGLFASASAVHTVMSQEPHVVVAAAEDVWFNAEARAIVVVNELQNRLLP